jgi:hypothetical protein
VTRLFLLLAAAAVLALLAAGPAGAQRTGSRIGQTATPGSEKDAAAAIEIIAQCLGDRRPDFLRRWLQMLPGTREEYRFVSAEEGDLSVCMDSQSLVLDGKVLTLKARSLRLPSARAMVRRMLPGAPAQSPMAQDSDPWFLAQLTALPREADLDRAALAFQDFGHCVAVRDWTGTLALLRAEPGSAREAAAVRKLVPVLGPCLTDDVKITITPGNLRDVLAEPVYHILAAAPAAPAKP